MVLYNVCDTHLKMLRLARVNEGSHSFICHPPVYPHGMSHPAFTAQPQSITALWLVLYSFLVLLRVGG